MIIYQKMLANSNPSESDSLKKGQKSKWWWAYPAQYKSHATTHNTDTSITPWWIGVKESIGGSGQNTWQQSGQKYIRHIIHNNKHITTNRQARKIVLAGK